MGGRGVRRIRVSLWRTRVGRRGRAWRLGVLSFGRARVRSDDLSRIVLVHRLGTIVEDVEDEDTVVPSQSKDKKATYAS